MGVCGVAGGFMVSHRNADNWLLTVTLLLLLLNLTILHFECSRCGRISGADSGNLDIAVDGEASLPTTGTKSVKT